MAQQQLSKQTKMAMASQFLGFMLDAYDMAMVLVMAPILVKVFVSPKGSAAWQYIVIVFSYSITMASRPIGSAIFGRYADKIGRRFLLVLTIGGVGVMSLLGGFLPTYAQIGVWSYVIFCLLRLVMGIFFGGEYAVGHTFAIEYAPQNRRGAIGGFIQSGFPLGYVFASLVFALISFSDYSEKPWRHMAGASRSCPASSRCSWHCISEIISTNRRSLKRPRQQGKIEKSPFLSLFKPPQVWDFLQVFFFMTGLFLTDYSVYGFLPNILTLKGRGFNTTTYSLIYGFALFMAFLGYNFYGWLSDRDREKNSHPVVLRLSRRVRNSCVLCPLSRGCPAELVDGSGRNRNGGNAEAGMGSRSRLLVRTLPDEAARSRCRLRLFLRSAIGSMV